MPHNTRFLTRTFGPAIATLVGLTACLGQNKAPEIITRLTHTNWLRTGCWIIVFVTGFVRAVTQG